MCVAAVVGVIGSLDHGTIGRQNFESGRLKDGLVHNEVRGGVGGWRERRL